MQFCCNRNRFGEDHAGRNNKCPKATKTENWSLEAYYCGRWEVGMIIGVGGGLQDTRTMAEGT